MDRRVRYTVLALTDALVQALHREHISEISVKELCDAADVNRSTFYAHFKDKYDLLEYIKNEILDNIKRQLDREQLKNHRLISRQALALILEYVKTNAELFKALLSDNCDASIQREIMDLAYRLTIPVHEEENERVFKYYTGFGVMGCLSVVQTWLKDDMPESPDELSGLMLDILYGGLDRHG